MPLPKGRGRRPEDFPLVRSGHGLPVDEITFAGQLAYLLVKVFFG